MSSPLPVSDDPFEVLGVAHDVAEKDLKKRYFQLLRQFPPETHPNEFNQVQRAYDALKDPQARAALADKKEPYEEVAEPYRSRLRDVLAQLQGGQVELARTALRTLLDENPELDDARNLLQQVLFNEEAFADAETQLAALVRRNPTNTWYLYRHALVLNKLGRHAEAQQASEAWLKVCQGKDALAWEFIAETLSAQKQLGEAHRRLEEGLKVVDHPAPLLLTRMHLRLEVADKAGLQSDVEALVRSLPPTDDESRQAASQRLQSLAALFFARTLPDQANLLLKTAKDLGGKTAGVQFPPSVEVFVEELPQASQQWLIDESQQPHIFRHNRRGKVGDVLLTLLFTLLWGVVALGSVLSTSGFSGWLAIPYALAAMLATVWLAWAWREAAWGFGVPHRRMISVHPLYMLEVGAEKVVAWPLVNFNEPRIVHQFTNGVYTASNVTLQFGKKKMSVSLRGQQLALDFANALHGYRTRALELMHGGLLEAEQGFDFIPLERLTQTQRSPLAVRKAQLRRRRWMMCAGVAVVLTAAAWATGVIHKRERTWAAAVNGASVSELAEAMGASPGGAPAALDPWRKAGLSASRQGLEATLSASDPRLVPLNALLLRLQNSSHPRLGFRLKVAGPQGQAGPQATSVSEREIREAFDRFPRRLSEGFAHALTQRAREVVAVSPGSAELGLVADVTLTPRILARSVQVGKTRWPRLGVAVAAQYEGQPMGAVEVELDDVDLALMTSADDAQSVLEAQVDRLLWKAGGGLARSLGLSAVP